MKEIKLHVIFGIGPVGTTLAEQLLSEGERVRLLSRSGRNPLGDRPGLEARAVDASQPEAAVAAASGADFVYNCVNVPYPEWAQKLTPLYDGILAAAEAAEAPLIIADNLYAYGPVSEPITESLPWTASTPKCRLRAELATRMLDAHRAGRTEVTIIQGSDFYGPRVINAHMGKRSFDPIVDGKTAFLVGDIDQPHTFTYISDYAKAMRIAGQNWEAFGRAWICPSVPAVSPNQFVARSAAVAGTKARARAIPGAILYAAGWIDPTMRELRETLYQFKIPFVANGDAFAKKFEMEPTPFEAGVRETIDWTRAQRQASVRPAGLATVL